MRSNTTAKGLFARAPNRIMDDNDSAAMHLSSLWTMLLVTQNSMIEVGHAKSISSVPRPRPSLTVMDRRNRYIITTISQVNAGVRSIIRTVRKVAIVACCFRPQSRGWRSLSVFSDVRKRRSIVLVSHCVLDSLSVTLLFYDLHLFEHS